MKVAVFKNAAGGFSVIYPAPGFDVLEVAKKDAPAGAAFRIIEAEEVPADEEGRAAWVPDLSKPDGVGQGAEL